MRYAYAPGGNLETISSAPVVESLIERDHGFPAQIQGTTVRNQSTGQTASVQDYDTYPQQIVRQGNTDKWTVLQSTSQDGVQPDGTWLTTETWGDMPYDQARQIARQDLGNYLQAYRTSYFTWGHNPPPRHTYSAMNEAASLYMQGMIAYMRDPTVVPDEVIDVDGIVHPIPDAIAWDAFYDRFERLIESASQSHRTNWKAVRAATTTDEVRNIMANLPAIPTIEDPNPAGAN